MSTRPARRVLAATATAAVLLTAATPAQAGILGRTLDTVSRTLSGTTGALSSTVQSLLGPTGWIVEDGQTSMAHVADVIGAPGVYARGYDGSGVGVALIDTGVVPVAGLTSGDVVNGADLSFESQSPGHAHLDGFGHGTHLAGIIAGNERSTLLGGAPFRGIAPGARLTSVKVGTTEGAVDVSQVVAAVDWVVEHRDDDPRNPIRVINLSYGTDGAQDHTLDPLTHAVENAWRAGIVVVAAGGNSGTDQPGLNNPAYDPYVLAVGASGTGGTVPAVDDVVPGFSSRGSAERRVDLVAPGSSIVSLRSPGSYVDEAYPSARVGDRFLKGSGSSQSAAVVSGAVALLLDARPTMTPDQVKAALVASAEPMPVADPAGRGAGQVDVLRALTAPVPRPAAAAQSHPRSTGLGSMEAARGSQHVAMDDVELRGERHVLGRFDARSWAPRSAAFEAWSAGSWSASTWTGSCWCTDTWTGTSWTGKSWTGKSWTGESWTSASWTGKSWTGKSWTGKSWTSAGWTGTSWTGKSWTGKSWT